MVVNIYFIIIIIIIIIFVSNSAYWTTPRIPIRQEGGEQVEIHQVKTYKNWTISKFYTSDQQVELIEALRRLNQRNELHWKATK